MNSEKKQIFLNVIVSPKSSRSVITIQDKKIKIYLNSPPVDGKANKECLSLVAKKLKIAKSKISIERGANSKNKKLKISDLTLKEIYDRLGINK